MKALDEYEIKARYVPTFLCLIPFSNFLVVFFGHIFFENIIQSISWMVIIADLGISFIIMLGLMQVQCTIAKHLIQDGIFGKGGLFFPSTTMLLYGNGLLSRERKNQIREKLLERAGIKLSNEIDEMSDIENARLQAREAVNAIRNIVGHGSFTITYNIRYGFWRNLIGGSFLVFFGALLCMCFYFYTHEWKALGFFGFYFLVFLALFLFRRHILESLGYSYADRLFSDFLSMTEGE
jgi:VIT1/CCC1 family predicted Fe2+/Mn2+ transporter